jgi:hypothetical protein
MTSLGAAVKAATSTAAPDMSTSPAVTPRTSIPVGGPDEQDPRRRPSDEKSKDHISGVRPGSLDKAGLAVLDAEKGELVQDIFEVV